MRSGRHAPSQAARHARHRMLLVVVELVVLVAMFFASGPLSLVPTAFAASLRPQKTAPPPANPGAGRFIPDLHAPKQPARPWHAPKPPKYPQVKMTPAQSPAAPGPQRTPGEQPDLRDAASETTLNKDGTWTRTMYPKPIHYQDAQGHWQKIDNTLIADSGEPGYALGNKANSYRVRFAAQTGGKAPTMQVRFPGATIAETLEGAATVTHTTAENTITYAGVFPGVDLRYKASLASVEETLVLRDAKTPASYTFTYHAPGLTASQDAAGDILFKDAQDQVVLRVGGIILYESDASGQMSPRGRSTEKNQLTLTGDGPDYTVTLTPDHDWLTDPSRTFPVAIDPTWSSQGPDTHPNTTSGNIYADTYDESANPNYDWNFSDVNTERIGNCTNTNGTGISRSYLKFQVGSAPAANLRIQQALLKLYQNTQYAGGTGQRIDVYSILSPWNATTLTWNNHPTNLSPVWTGAGATSANVNVTVNFDVGMAMYLWWQGGVANNGLMLRYRDEAQQCQWFYSDDRTDNLPKLDVTYVTDGYAPAGTMTVNGSTVGQALLTNNPNMALTTTPSDDGATYQWSSDWSSVNGVSTNGGGTPTWSVDSTHTQLTADTAGCGSTTCWSETFFTHAMSAGGEYTPTWPTYTAMFKTDDVSTFQFGVVGQNSASTRFMLGGNAAGTALTSLQYSYGAGSFSTASVNVPMSPNTWYYGQVVFPLYTTGEIYLWPVGQPRPTTPTVSRYNLAGVNWGLNFWHNGDNGSNRHQITIGNVYMTTGSVSASHIGYGASQTQFSNDGTNWGCPAPGSGAWCVAAQQQTTTWTLSPGDGTKSVYVRFRDNSGKVSTAGSFTGITLDTTPPTVSITGPVGGQEVRGEVPVTVSTSDSGTGVMSLQVFDNGVEVPYWVRSTSTDNWDTTNLAPGAHELTAKATDAAGNSATSAPVTVYVNNTGQMSSETFATRTLPDGEHAVSVNTGNGDALVTHTDLAVPDRGPGLAIARTYNSLAPVNGLFGWGWMSNLDAGLSGISGSSITYHDASGGIHVFASNGSGGYTAPPGLFATLTVNGDGSYTLTGHDQTKTNFNSSGYLTSIVDRNGNPLTVAYDTSNLPTTVTDAAGRTLTITTGGGHITQIAGPGARTFMYAYDGGGQLTDYTDPGHVVTHYAYGANHLLTGITLNYQSGGPTDSQTNVATQLTYYQNSNDQAYLRLLDLVDPMQFDVPITYTDLDVNTGNGQLTPFITTVQQMQTAPAGSTPVDTTPTSPDANRHYEQTTYTLTLDGRGTVAQLTDPVGGITSYQYNSNGQVTQTTQSVSASTTRVSTSTYDSNGNQLTHVVDPTGLNLKTTWTYDSANNVLTETDPLGHVTQYTYDAPTTGNLTQTVANYVAGQPSDEHTNVTTSASYDSSGEPLTVTDPLGHVTQYTYDNQGDVTRTIQNYVSGGPTDSQTNVTTLATYDDLGQRETATDANGVVSQTIYDIRGRVLRTTANYVSGGAQDDHTNVQTNLAYDALGRAITTTDPKGVVSRSIYDADGRVTSSTQNYVSGGPSDSETNVTTTTAYDGAGNATLQTDAKGNTTTTQFDAANRAYEVVVKDTGGTQLSDTKTAYDWTGAVVSTQVLDGDHNPVTNYTYDTAGRVATKTAPPANPGASDATGQSNVTHYTYDADGQVTDTFVTNTQVTTGNVDAEHAAYDPLGHLTTKIAHYTTGSAQQTTYAYDKNGQQTSMTAPEGTTTYGYDALGRTTTVWHPDTSTDTATYDKAGHTQTTTNSSGTTIYVYDALWRVTSEQHKDASGTVTSTTSYAYDVNGHLLTPITTDGDGHQTSNVTYSYDALGRVSGFSSTEQDGTHSVSYDQNGNLFHIGVTNQGNSVYSMDFGWDGANRQGSLSDKVGPGNALLNSYAYTYDARGNQTQITINGTQTFYTYDQANELLRVEDSTHTPSATYTYDVNHNRKTLVTAAGTTTYSYDPAGVKLTSLTDPNGKQTTFAYDAAGIGNLTSKTYDPSGLNQTTSYQYDTTNRLSEVDAPDGTSVAFAYDADGNRVKKTVTTGSTTTMVKDTYQGGRIAYETDGANTLLATFTYDADGRPSSVQVGGDPATAPRYYYVYNGHGDVVGLVDASGTAVTSYRYDAFGQVLVDTDPSVFTTGWRNPYLYDGKDRVRYDTETGLYWMSVRAYDPTLGRFLSRDPLGRAPVLGLTTQPYVYADNNPLRNVDPSGQRTIDMDGHYEDTLAQVRKAHSTSIQSWHGTLDCRVTNPNAFNWACRSYWGAIGWDTAVRNNALQPLQDGANFKITLGLVMAAVSDVAGLVMKNEGILEKLVAGYGALTDIVGALTYAQGLLDRLFGLQPGVITGLLRPLNGFASLIHGGIQLLRDAGPGLMWIADKASSLGFAALKGVPGLVTSLLEKIAGDAVLTLISAGGHALQSDGFRQLADYQAQAGMDLGMWCQQHSNAGCDPIGSPFVTV